MKNTGSITPTTRKPRGEWPFFVLKEACAFRLLNAQIYHNLDALFNCGLVLQCSGDNTVDGETKAIAGGDLTRGSLRPPGCTAIETEVTARGGT